MNKNIIHDKIMALQFLIMKLFVTKKLNFKKETAILCLFSTLIHYNLGYSFSAIRIKSLLLFSFSLISFHSIKSQQLQFYIQEALANNPNIQVFELRYNRAKEKENEANWLPNTEINAGYFLSEPETRTGAQRARFSIKQMLPWFGSITARKNYARSMAEAEFVEIAIAKRKLILSITQSYYQLYEIQAKQKILEHTIQLLQTYEQLALTAIEIGKAGVVDVLQLQIRQNELQQQKEVLEEIFISEQTIFKHLLNSKEKRPINVPWVLDIPIEDELYNKKALTLNPELLKYDALYKSVTQLELVNQSESNPMIGFGLEYIPVSERPDLNFSDNGKDIFMPTVSISIPVFNNRYQSISKQNKLHQQEIKLQKEDRLTVLKSTLIKTKSKRNQIRIAYTTQVKNIKQTQNAESILIKKYETGSINFNDVLNIKKLQLKFQLHQIKLIKEYYIQTAILNYLITQ